MKESDLKSFVNSLIMAIENSFSSDILSENIPKEDLRIAFSNIKESLWSLDSVKSEIEKYKSRDRFTLDWKSLEKGEFPEPDRDMLVAWKQPNLTTIHQPITANFDPYSKTFYFEGKVFEEFTVQPDYWSYFHVPKDCESDD